MNKLADEERAYHDAQATVEAWQFALGVLGPWVEAARAIGSEELEWAMEHAHEAAVLEHTRAIDELRVLDSS